MPVTRSYSLPDEIVQVVDSLPKRERSNFVSSALLKAIRIKSRQDALDILASITPVKTANTRSSVELVEDSRNRQRNIRGSGADTND